MKTDKDDDARAASQKQRKSSVKALSLLQPWASLVIMGIKKIETRSWTTAYRGPLFIHASVSKKGKIVADELPICKYIPDFLSLPFGAIIGQVYLQDVVPVEQLSYSDEKLNALTLEGKAFGEYSSRYAWMLEEPVALDQPIQIKGSLGLWKYDIN